MDIRIKMCGLRRREDIGYVNEVLPDYAGFILSRPFWRSISREELKELTGLLDPSVMPVGVFVDETEETVASYLESGLIAAAQLHGQEDDKYIRRLRELTDRPLIKAFRIESREDARRAEASAADYILLDHGTGTGSSFDWSFLQGIERPYILAGGLTPDNVEEALERTKPYALDVSSGIETDRCKDPEKMRLFALRARGFQEK